MGQLAHCSTKPRLQYDGYHRPMRRLLHLLTARRSCYPCGKNRMEFTIEPYAGVLPIRLGMTRAEVRRLLGPEAPVTKKLFVSPLPRDTFRDTGVHVYYKDPDVCEAVELFSPSVPTLHGQPILGRPYNEVERWLQQLDPSSRRDPTGMRAL